VKKAKRKISENAEKSTLSDLDALANLKHKFDREE